MSRKQYRAQGGSHEKKMTRKDRKKQRAEWDANRAPVDLTPPSEEDKVQLKNLGLYSAIGIILLLAVMYYFFAFS